MHYLRNIEIKIKTKIKQNCQNVYPLNKIATRMAQGIECWLLNQRVVISNPGKYFFCFLFFFFLFFFLLFFFSSSPEPYAGDELLSPANVRHALSVVCHQELNNIFSETTRPRALIFGMKHCLVDLYQVYSVGDAKVKMAVQRGFLGSKM